MTLGIQSRQLSILPPKVLALSRVAPTDEPWQAVLQAIPEPDELETASRGGGSWRVVCDVSHAQLAVLRTGAPWAARPRSFPTHPTVRRRSQRWEREGVVDTVLRALAAAPYRRGRIRRRRPGTALTVAPGPGELLRTLRRARRSNAGSRSRASGFP